MITVTIGTNTQQRDITVNPNSTLKDILEQEKISYATGGLHLNGEPVKAADIQKTFTEMGIVTDCMLISVVKATGGR